MQEIKKEYVSILAQIHRDGSIQPLGILLEDGRKYDIDEVKDKCRAASLKAGGCGIRYTISADFLRHAARLLQQEPRQHVKTSAGYGGRAEWHLKRE